MADKELNEMENEVEVAETETEATVAKEKKAQKKDKEVQKKQGFFAKLGSLLKRFFKTMKSELKKVTWFSRKQTYTSTLLVLAVMALFAIAIGVLDLGLSQGLEALANNINILKK